MSMGTDERLTEERLPGTRALRDHPGILWMVVAAITAILHPFVSESRWLMVHMIALGALTHSIIVWSAHFTTTLLKTRQQPPDHTHQNRRLAGLHLGILAVIIGVPTTWWPLTVIGAAVIVAVVVWHAVEIGRRLRGALPGRFRIVIRYYLTAAAFLPVGVTLGVLLARGHSEELHARLLLGHSIVNVFGWVALTVVGTLITLWPTILRTRMDEASERRAQQALPLLAGGLIVTVTGALLGWRWLLLAGLIGYLLGLLWTGRSLLGPARAKPPMHFASWSVAAGCLWFLVGIVLIGWRVATAADVTAMATDYGPIAGVLIAGFGLQVLTGALSHLMPAVIGGGPRVVRVGIEAFDRFAMTRIVIINVPLALALLPVPAGVRILLTVLVLVGFVSFLPVLIDALRRIIAARRAAVAARERGERPDREAGRAETARVLDPPFPRTQLLAGITIVALAMAAGPAIQPILDGGATTTTRPAPAVEPTGQTTRVEVRAHADMTFEPSHISVPAGDRLIITLTNTDDSTVHDLYFDDATQTRRLAPGESATLDVGIMGQDREGWCTVTGHRAMGMTLQIEVTGAPDAGPGDDAAADGTGHADHENHDGFALDPSRQWPADHEAVDAALPPLPDTRTHRLTLRVQETELEVAPGQRLTRWTFGGDAPGPVLHGRVGDEFVIRLVNDGTIGHSIDFHAGALAPDRPMRTIAPGEELTYTFTAERAGVWMYHCGTMPVSTHIAHGMHGAVVIEPPDLPEVDRSYLLTASELYAGDQTDERSAATTFNGRAFQYDADPLEARVGERVRFWVLDAGPNEPMSFHVIGGQFDTVWAEGAYRLGGPDQVGGPDTGSQALGLMPAQGGFVELTFPEAGHYPFVNHIMASAEKGAHGIVRVRP